MKHKISLFLIISVMLCGLAAKGQTNTPLFPTPVIPDSKTTLSERCNYLVYNYWERCNVKQSFSSLSRLNEAFGTWASFMPYATADTVHLAIDNYIKLIEKETPKSMPEVAQMAKNWFFCDTAQYFSEELYLPFCRAAANGKKMPKAEKSVYQAQLKILESSSIGQRVPNIKYTRADGSIGNLDEVLASRIVLFFNDPDCLDCSLMKARLAADYNTNRLIQDGLIRIVALYPGEATDEWRAEAARYPENWEVGACDYIDEYFDLPNLPKIYWIDGRHKVVGKDVDLDGLLYLINQIYQGTQMPSPAQPVQQSADQD